MSINYVDLPPEVDRSGAAPVPSLDLDVPNTPNRPQRPDSGAPDSGADVPLPPGGSNGE